MLEPGERFYPVRHGFTHTDSAKYWDGSGNAHAVAAGRVGYSRLQQIWLFFCFDFSCATNGFRKLAAKVRKGPRKSFPQKTTQKPKCVSASQPRHFHAISLFLPWDFLCTSCCLTGCLVSLVPATGSDYSCRRDSWSVLWFLGEIEMNMMITNLLLHFFYSSFHSFTKFHKWVLSLKQDVVGLHPRHRGLRWKVKSFSGPSSFPSGVWFRRFQNTFLIRLRRRFFCRGDVNVFGPIFIFPYLWPSWVLVVFSCIHFWNPEVYQANLVVWVFGPSAATSTLASGAGVNSANSLVRSLAPEALTFLTHGSVFPSSMSSQQVVTTRSGTFPRRFKNANLGLIFAACGGFCFSAWPCLGSLVEGQTQWEIQASKVNASAFFFIYALGAVIAVLFLLPPLCRWPLHTGVSLNFWRDGCAQQKYSQNKLELEFSRLRATYFKSLFLLLVQHVFFQNFLIPFAGENGFSYIFGRSYIELSSWQHFLGLSGGFAHGLGCLLSIQAGRILGNAMAMSITRCQPLVCASWGVLVWGELNGAGYKTTLIFTGMLLMFLLALIFFLLATAGASWIEHLETFCSCVEKRQCLYILDLLCVQYGPRCKASVDASSGITKLRTGMSSTATPWITFSLCCNLPGHDSPWFAFVVWSKRFCQMVVWAWHVTRCPLNITLISGGWQELSLSHDRRLLSRIDEHGRPLCP